MLYTPVKSGDVPGGMKWKHSVGKPSPTVIIEYSMGMLYKRATDTRTGTVLYYRLLREAPPVTPAEQIDAEPTSPPRKTRFRIGSRAWFVDTDARWYLCTVIARSRTRITIRPAYGHDDTREKPWPYGGDLEFGTQCSVFQRLRPLSARKA